MLENKVLILKGHLGSDLWSTVKSVSSITATVKEWSTSLALEPQGCPEEHGVHRRPAGHDEVPLPSEWDRRGLLRPPQIAVVWICKVKVMELNSRMKLSQILWHFLFRTQFSAVIYHQPWSWIRDSSENVCWSSSLCKLEKMSSKRVQKYRI